MARRREKEQPVQSLTDVQMPGSIGKWCTVFAVSGNRILQIRTVPVPKAPDPEELPWVTPAALQRAETKKVN
jgi:hypothetical protein